MHHLTPTSSLGDSPDFDLVTAALACLAIAVPTLLAFNLPPSATYFNQILSLLGWGGWLFHLSRLGPLHLMRPAREVIALLLALSFLTCAPLLSAAWWTRLPRALSLSSAAVFGAAALAVTMGASVNRSDSRFKVFLALCLAVTIAGVASGTVGIVQVIAPGWADGDWIARTSVEGRAVGNLRQPNHLCSLLLWSIVAVLWLGQARVFRQALCATLAAAMLFVVVLSGSRSGLLGALGLALWGLLDRHLLKPTRAALLLAPVAFALFWSGLVAWAHYTDHAFAGASRFGSDSDISSSRFGIWANTLALIKAHSWTGVGFGEFNFAWTLTEFPDRPIAFFDHTHNLPLHFAVELGLPLAGVVLGLLGWALLRAARNCLRPRNDTEPASPQRAAFVMVLLVLMHSMLEYPLWYAYFLLPTAFALGLCLGNPTERTGAVAATPSPTRPTLVLRTGALLLLLGSAYSIYDYLSVVVIFAPPENAAPLTQRIATGQRSVFFSHHADYAAATTSEDPKIALAAAQRAAHYLLDTRLMMAWANALRAIGDTDRAKYVAARLKEFRNPQSESYFAPCSDTAVAVTDKPYQCFPPQRKFTFKDFR
jgi:O-antigen ligase